MCVHYTSVWRTKGRPWALFLRYLPHLSPPFFFPVFFWGGEILGEGDMQASHWSPLDRRGCLASRPLSLPPQSWNYKCVSLCLGSPPPSLFCFVMFLNIGSEDQTQVTLARSLPSPSRAFLMFLYPVRKDMELDCAWIFLWVQYQLYRLPIN